ncbi:hypothetical protein PM082_004394 [Marasmius tenuissimus]|nr:hypothetical protein PM082_004394 [Marasmius tenuissimus]
MLTFALADVRSKPIISFKSNTLDPVGYFVAGIVLSEGAFLISFSLPCPSRFAFGLYGGARSPPQSAFLGFSYECPNGKILFFPPGLIFCSPVVYDLVNHYRGGVFVRAGGTTRFCGGFPTSPLRCLPVSHMSLTPSGYPLIHIRTVTANNIIKDRVSISGMVKRTAGDYLITASKQQPHEGITIN